MPEELFVFAALPAGTRVEVAYDLTSLGSDGDQAVASMDEAGFECMLEEWHRLIRAALERESATVEAPAGG